MNLLNPLNIRNTFWIKYPMLIDYAFRGRSVFVYNVTPISIDYISWDFPDLTPQTANTLLNGIAVFLFFRHQTHWRNLVSPTRPLSPAENNPWDFLPFHPLNGEHIPLKDRHVPVFGVRYDWRNLVSPTRPLSPAEINRCPRQRAFGRLSSDAPKILWTYIGSKPVHWTIILWHMPLRVRSYVVCPVHRNFLKFYQQCRSL